MVQMVKVVAMAVSWRRWCRYWTWQCDGGGGGSVGGGVMDVVMVVKVLIVAV